MALFQIFIEMQIIERNFVRRRMSTLITPFRAPDAIFRQGRSIVTQVISSPSCASTIKNAFRPESISHAPKLELSAQVIN